jgi:uncharacterized protein
MKQLIISINVFLFSHAINAQLPQPVFANNPFPKTITVSGSAEMEIIPDEIYVNIELKEYLKKGENKKDLETIKKFFLDASKSVGIADSSISIVSFTGNNPFFWKKRKKDPNLFTSIVYQVKFKSSELMDKLVERLDDEATQSFLIVSTSHSKIKEFRRHLKIEAVKAAKEKGIYLTEAVGERLGEAVTIKEPGEFFPSMYKENLMSNSFISYGVTDRPPSMEEKAQEVDFKKMKLRFEVEVVFALK